MADISDRASKGPPLSRDPDMTTASATPTQMAESIPAECADADRIVALTFQTAFANWPFRFGLMELRRFRHEVAGEYIDALDEVLHEECNTANSVGEIPAVTKKRAIPMEEAWGRRVSGRRRRSGDLLDSRQIGDVRARDKRAQHRVLRISRRDRPRAADDVYADRDHRVAVVPRNSCR